MADGEKLADGIYEYAGSEVAKALAEPGGRERLGGADTRVFVLENADPELRAAVEGVLRAMPELVAQHRAEALRDRLQELVDVFTPETVPTATDVAIAQDNAALRQQFLDAEPCLTSRDIHERAGARGKNVSQTANAWKRQGRIFAVPHRGRDLYPAFQFREGAPHPAIPKVLAALPADMTAWQTAFWFVTGNGWLNGAPPKDALDRVDDVVAAAEREARDVVG
jgi:hypothetical protein